MVALSQNFNKFYCYNSRQEQNRKFSPQKTAKVISFGINPLATVKQHAAIASYQSSMQAHTVSRVDFFINALRTLKTVGSNKKIVDVGSCTGDLCRCIREHFPLYRTIGCDINSKMIEKARELDAEKGLTAGSEYLTANALDMNLPEQSVDAVCASSSLHELYSYDSPELGDDKFSLESIRRFLKNSLVILKPGGKVISTEPAKPSDFQEILRLTNLNKTNGRTPACGSDEELLAADVTQLSTYDLLRRFCREFEPAQGKYSLGRDFCEMPKGLVTEFIRHRKFAGSQGDWDDEMNEQYGVVTPQEIREMAKDVGFDILRAENSRFPQEPSFYSVSDDEFHIENLRGRRIRMEDEFPYKLFLELEKNS